MYLFLALFWVAVAVIVQIYWEALQEHAFIPVNRTVMGLIFFILFSYNFLRWRLSRAQQEWKPVKHTPPPRPRVVQEPDPTFDFTDDKKPPSGG